MAMVPAVAARALAYRMGMNALRGGVRAPRYSIPSWARYANMAAAYSAGKKFLKDTRSARARASSIVKSIYKKSRKRAQGQARAKKIAAKRAIGPVPKTTASRVPGRYAVAPRMRRIKSAKAKGSQKQPKSAIVHYKEYGQYNARQVMYINHEHIGSVNKMWFGIALGLSKALLAKARIYPAKSIDDPMIGPRTKPTNTYEQYDDKTAQASTLRLVFAYGGYTDPSGQQGTFYRDILIENIGTNPDAYYPLSTIARNVANELMTGYYTTAVNNVSLNGGAWLNAAQIFQGAPYTMDNVSPIYVNNLDDAEIHLYVNSLIKFQNITIADHGYTENNVHGATVTEQGVDTAYNKDAIDANPLIGRVYAAKGLSPDIDTELGLPGSTLDTFFQDRHESGITLCGSNTAPNATELGRIQNVPPAKEIYGGQTVTTGHLAISPGSMKFYKTSFRLVKTFKELSKYMIPYDKGATGGEFPTHQRHAFRHTLFGIKCAHQHGADEIRLGWNRDQSVGCYVKINKKIFPLRAQYNNDMHTTTVSTIPATTYLEADGPAT